MKLFFDENLGRSIPEALRLVGVRDIWYLRSSNPPPTRLGARDEDWLPWAGQNGYLVISCNKAILQVAAQRQLLIDWNVGAVFLRSGNDIPRNVLRVLLNKWDWLEDIDAHVPRPFAYMLGIRGDTQRVL